MSAGGFSAAASDSSPKIASARRSTSWSRHSCMTASAAGVLKSSSSAAENRDQVSSGPGTCGLRKTSRKPSALALAADIASSEKSSGPCQWPVRKKTSVASRPHVSSTLRRETSFPSDLCISAPPSSSMPLCIQIRANGRPTARDCAISFSWCGNTRSSPPPWIKNSGPSVFSAMAEHSMCHPGRPRPHGESHHVSSSGLFAFQRAKSRGSSFSRFGSCSSTWSGR